jgi:serine/threonine-protein kinase
MISTGGRVLLTDFGIAQAPESTGERLTRTGIFMGTPEYISPEQASAQRVDGRSDLYSLGITTYEIITGQVPFSGATPQLMLAHLQSPPPPLSSVDPGQPPELDLVLARALAKRPERRFQSGVEFVAALRDVARRYQVVESSAADLAGLIQTANSAGQGTISITRGDTPASAPPVVRPPGPPSRRVPPVSSPGTPASRPPGPSTARAGSPPQTIGRPGGALVGQITRDWRIMLPIGIALAALLFLLMRAAFGAPQPITPRIPTPSAAPTEPPVTIVPATLRPSATPTDTATAAPTLTPTLAPTFTRVPQPTARPPTLIPATDVAPTEIPPTETPTEIPPTETPTEIPPTETPTEIPPTETPTVTSAPYPPPETPGTPAPTVLITAAVLPPTTVLVTLTPTVSVAPTATPTTSPSPTATETPTASATATVAATSAATPAVSLTPEPSP